MLRVRSFLSISPIRIVGRVAINGLVPYIKIAPNQYLTISSSS